MTGNSVRELTPKMQNLPYTSPDRVKSPLVGWLFSCFPASLQPWGQQPLVCTFNSRCAAAHTRLVTGVTASTVITSVQWLWRSGTDCTGNSADEAGQHCNCYPCCGNQTDRIQPRRR